jgi:gas vesicle structural protein
VNEPDALTSTEDLSLAELINRVLDRGALITGEVLISVAGVDLVYVGLQVVIAAAETAQRHDILRGR